MKSKQLAATVELLKQTNNPDDAFHSFARAMKQAIDTALGSGQVMESGHVLIDPAPLRDLSSDLEEFAKDVASVVNAPKDPTKPQPKV
jgi:hypothetical protein